MSFRTALVIVEGGKMLTPGMVRNLIGTVPAKRAEIGLLIVGREV
jgi:hypothetical protein